MRMELFASMDHHRLIISAKGLALVLARSCYSSKGVVGVQGWIRPLVDSTLAIPGPMEGLARPKATVQQ